MWMSFPPAKDPVRRRLEPAHQRLWSEASTSKLASPGTCCILHASVQFPPKDFKFGSCATASWNDLTNRCYIFGSVHALLGDGDVSSWHETVMPVPSPQVRYEAMNGPSSVAVRGQSLTHLGHSAKSNIGPIFRLELPFGDNVGLL